MAYKAALSLLLFGLLTSSSYGQSLEEDLEEVFETYELMGLSVAVSTNLEVVSYHYGLRDLDRQLPVDTQTKFRIASISKSYTALGIIKLADQGLIDLDADISNYLSFSVENPNYPSEPITARMLLSHTSSLQDGSGYSGFLTATYNQNPIPELSALLTPGGDYYTTNMWRQESPGSFFAYSNINFGLIGTLIEAISGQRFDQYMKSEILDPLGITGSFNIQDLPEIDDLGVLYRNNGGWQPQVDNYQGIMPPPPDLSDYVLGTNGLYFAPQGGLRCTAEEVVLLMDYLDTDGATASLGIAPGRLQEMKISTWLYDGNNGDNYGGLFNRWAHGLHVANVTSGDQICGITNDGAFIGHPGEAYGLVSDGYFSEQNPVSFSLLINGIWGGYQTGNQSAYYQVEEAIFGVLCDYFSNTLHTLDRAPLLHLGPNPTAGTLQIHPKTQGPYSLQLFDLKGRQVHSFGQQSGSQILDLSQLPSGLYLLHLKHGQADATYKIIKQ